MVKKLVKDQKYLITWRDHFSTEGWFELEKRQVESDFTLDTVGFFYSEDKNYYHFVRTLADHVAADMMSILKNQVVNIKVIK